MKLDRQHYIGTTLPGGYKIQKFIGKGAFAWVYYANTPDGRPTAVKIQYNLNDDSRKRFMREIKVLRELPPSPYCISYVGDGHTEEGLPFLAMEFVNGQNLKQILRKRPVWPERDACEFMCQLCEAFSGLHELGLAHRDVKPENIMITHDNAVKLMDFGLVKDAQGLLKLLESEDIMTGRDFAENIDRGVLAGTPEYMAPEQFSDPSVEDEALTQTDTWTDVYSLGLIFFELLTGRRLFPFQAASPQNQTEHAQVLLSYLAQRTSFDDSKLQRPAAASPSLWSIIERSLRQHPKARYRNAAELGEQVRHYLDTGEVSLVEDDEKTSAMKVDQFMARYGQELLKRQMERDAAADAAAASASGEDGAEDDADDGGGHTVPLSRDQLTAITANIEKAQSQRASAATAPKSAPPPAAPYRKSPPWMLIALAASTIVVIALIIVLLS